MRKPDQHGIFVTPPDNNPWGCGFGKCTRPSIFTIRNVWFQKKGDKIADMGACFECALKWATKDKCESCLKRINENRPTATSAKGQE